MMDCCGSEKKAALSHVVHLASAALVAAMAVTPILGQAPAKATSLNQTITKETHLSVDVTVVDPTNAVIRKANVTLSPGKDTVTLGTSTDARGVARFRGMSKGSYDIIVQSAGFSAVQEMVTIKKTEHLRIKLQIAVKLETVEVRAAPAVVDTVVNVSAGPLPYVPFRELPLDFIRLAIL
jgi:hypothetical protein